ncbi:tRNA (adenosine(37)-N6)-threonylcarbamoyltransferase complex dimerization subunit type 1 TsaB [Spongiivirga citrea]|uniref:tRNA (Adenosine(37)-N6)-threonylcarbamoyltransferase complex dimerization subunit type 1 TsaB n=1 Tax=Spongiivirga citrea TaxID=1481457 RepID=A0A6M0CKT4_9FLAO|nr:tRNA (adenosine(37)-N6)-threonylcarbamoyltransferase complex dimerization subunit type 1 TsaB [Spongiivirga citrea]NER18252.1 tRNA (adenosine(37)-N6)-threonylcarbamoyltransferase complex dimerization subunit type 1 TsaB [Spongiivirga citrea]
MAYILNIETATTNCSVSVGENGELKSLVELNEKEYSHAENLHVFIKQAIAEAGINLSDLSAIAVSKGPGSYTGLRIGVSAAKGLAFSLDIPLIAVTTLTSMAHQNNNPADFIIPMLDARRMEVYAQVHDTNKTPLKETTAEIIEETSFAEYLAKGTVSFIGNGATKCQGVITHKNAIFDNNILEPTAKEMVSISYEKYKNKEFEDVAYFEPYYLKDFIAGKKKA